MIKSVSMISIFASYPRDIEEEIQVINDTITELNITLPETRRLYLELKTWDTHTFPDVGDDPQSIINQQISEYDIFIGLLWKRFGTKTPRSLSGTKEEFDIAYSKAQEDPNSIKLLFYFNNSPFSIDDIDPDQIKMVKDFKTNLSDLGVLYKEYTNIEEFGHMLRMNLNSVIAGYGKDWGVKNHKTEVAQEDIKINKKEHLEEDLGYLDSLEIAEENFSLATEITERITGYMEVLTEKTINVTNEMNSVETPVSASRSKIMINKGADNLLHFSQNLEGEIPRLSDSYFQGIYYFGQAAELWLDLKSEDKKSIVDARDSVINAIDSLLGTVGAIISFREVISSLPRITSKFNQAKRSSLSAIDALLNELNSFINLSKEVQKTMERIIESS